MTLDELTTPLTTDEVKAKIYTALAAYGVNTTTWKPGGVVRTVIASVSIIGSAFSKLQATIAKQGFLELAEGDWLELKARYDYDVEKDKGSFATGYVVLDNNGGGVYSGGPGDLIVTNPTTGKSYTNTASYSLGAMATITVPVQALEIGSASSSAANTIVAFETSLLGVDVTNPLALVGTDAESDPSLRAKAREKTAAASPNGPSDAYSYFAKAAKRADGSPVGVTRVRPVPDGYGNVDLYVANASGLITGDAGDVSTDLGVISDAIQRRVEPLAVNATVISATPHEIDVTYELWVRDVSSLTDIDIAQRVFDALKSYLADVPIGGIVLSPDPGKVFKSALETIIGSAIPNAIVKVVVTSPAGDVTLDIDEAPALGDSIATDIHQVIGGVL